MRFHRSRQPADAAGAHRRRQRATRIAAHRTAAMPDPTIEEIESALRKARFEESDSDRMIAARARRKMTEAWIRNSKDSRVQQAFVEGYKAAFMPDWQVALVAGGALVGAILFLWAMGAIA